MLMVETELRASSIHGIGVFLTQSVRAGQLIWRFDSRIDRVFSEAELDDMPQALQRFLRTYSTLHDDLKLWVLCGDNGRHFNHSDTPSTRSLGIAFGDDVAAKMDERGSWTRSKGCAPDEERSWRLRNWTRTCSGMSLRARPMMAWSVSPQSAPSLPKPCAANHSGRSAKARACS